VGTIALAKLTRVYDAMEVEKALASEDVANVPVLKRTLERMHLAGEMRFSVLPSSPQALDPLYAECPNFRHVIDDLREYVALALAAANPPPLPPILLAGDPGVGKTYFAKRLAKALGTTFDFVPMSTVSAGFVLAGAAATWKDARPGKVARSIVDGDYANPLLVLDEIDKASSHTQHDPLGPLYQLMEPSTATHFRDEFIDIEFNCASIAWVATANEPANVPDPLLNRMRVYAVPAPTPEQAVSIAQQILQAIIAECRIRFDDTLTDSVAEKLTRTSVRTMRQVLMRAVGAAVAAGRRSLLPEDIRVPQEGRRTIGF
jgi:ATP-dependent Lon protease